MVISNFLLLPSVFVVFSRLDSFSPSQHKGISMLVDCFLSLWFLGLINLGEYSEGKATRNHALAVYKSGALRSVNSRHPLTASSLGAARRSPSSRPAGHPPPPPQRASASACCPPCARSSGHGFLQGGARARRGYPNFRVLIIFSKFRVAIFKTRNFKNPKNPTRNFQVA